MPTSIQDKIRAAALEQGIPSALALAVAEHESSFDPLAQGKEITVGGKKVRAQGLFQLLPDTAASLKVDPADPAQNIAGGVRYLRTLLDQHKGDPDPLGAALSTYGGVVHDTEYVPSLKAKIERYRLLEAANATANASATARQGGAGPAGQPKVGNLTNPTGRASGAGPGGGASAMTPPAGPPGPGFLQSVVNSVDPRRPEGRRNLVGMAGEVGLSTIAAIPVVGPEASLATRILTTTGRVAVPAIGAAAGGAADEIGEQMAGTSTADPNHPVRAVAEAAGMQGAYSVGGQMTLWPLRLGGRAFLGTSVGQAAKAGVEEGVTLATAAKKTMIANARATGRAGVDAARDFAATSMRDLTGRLAGSLADVELENNVAIEGAKSLMNQIGRPSIPGVVTAMREVFTGPTKVALDKSGEQVAAAAVSGPVVNLAPLQASLEKMVSKAKPSSLFPGPVEVAAGPGAMAVPVAANSATKRAAAGVTAEPQRITAEEFKALITQQNALPAEERLPLTGILETIRGFVGNIGDARISFADAHALKRLLDERVTWDRPAKAINEQLTKGIRTQLREILAVHEPYNVATAAYAQLSNLYRRGVGRKLSAAFRNNPDAAATMLDPKSPSSAVALRSLLVEQGAAGGDAAGGQAAWDGARSVFTHAKLLKGGADGLNQRIAKLRADSPEFFKTLYGDPVGQEIIGNLTKIGAAVEQAQQQGAFRTAVVKEAGEDATTALASTTKAATRTAKRSQADLVADATTKADEAIAASKATRERFQKSSMVPPKTSAQMLGDVAHVAAGGLRTGWAVRSLIRLVQAPSSADLLQWAAYSPARTQQMVRILTSPIPDRAAAGFLRAAVTAIGSANRPAASAKTPAKPASVVPETAAAAP